MDNLHQTDLFTDTAEPLPSTPTDGHADTDTKHRATTTAGTQSKECCKCHQTKPLDSAHWQFNSTRKDGYSSRCRDCERTRDKERATEPHRHAYNQARTANTRANGHGKLTPLDVLSKERDTCYWCHRPFSGGTRRASLDHVKPLARGGTNTRANIEYVCVSCNRLKGSMSIKQWLGTLATLGITHRLMSPSTPIQLRLIDD